MYRYTQHYIKCWSDVYDPEGTREVIVGDGDCNYSGRTVFDLSGFTNVERIVIGSNSFTNVVTLNLTGLNELVSISIGDSCFGEVNELRIEGLNKLENVTIGMNSFTQYKNYYYYNTKRKLYLRNCPLLKEVRIGRYSFSDYSYSYVENLESLELLEYGDVNETSYNFFNIRYASFESD